MRNVPLSRQDEIVVTDLLEVPLLPPASIHECNVALRERHQRVGLRKVGENRGGIRLRIPDDVRHPRLFPSIVDLGMARAAGKGSDVMSSRAPVVHTGRRGLCCGTEVPAHKA